VTAHTQKSGEKVRNVFVNGGERPVEIAPAQTNEQGCPPFVRNATQPNQKRKKQQQNEKLRVPTQLNVDPVLGRGALIERVVRVGQQRRSRRLRDVTT
jgi:hypothetical protein